MKGRSSVLLFVLALLLTCDSPTATPSSGIPDGEMAAYNPQVTITISPPVAYLEKGDTLRFTATVVEDGDTLDVNPWWSMFNSDVAHVDTAALVTAVSDGFAVLIAEYGSGLGAAAIVVDAPPPVEVTFRDGYIMQQTQNKWRAGIQRFVAGRPVLVRGIVTADRENDWEPTGLIEAGWPPPGDTLPLTPPDGGIPVELAVDDWKHLDSSFHGVIPGELVTEDQLFVGLDWNTDDGVIYGYGAEVVEVPDFHLVIVPVIWDSVPDYRILEDLEGITADSFAIIGVQQMLPVRPHYPVTVLEPFVTKQNLTSEDGWAKLLAEIASIRIADGQRAYYYGALRLPKRSAAGGIGYIGYPASAGALRAITHELGHNMSLRHAPCGSPARVDSLFPYEDGSIGQGGFDFFWNHTLKDPTEQYDVMSYCGPRWISDYHFNKALDYRIEEESKWWDSGAADLELPPVIVDPVGEFRSLSNDSANR